MGDGGVVHLEPGFARDTLDGLRDSRPRSSVEQARGVRRLSSDPARPLARRVLRRVRVAQGRPRGRLLKSMEHGYGSDRHQADGHAAHRQLCRRDQARDRRERATGVDSYFLSRGLSRARRRRGRDQRARRSRSRRAGSRSASIPTRSSFYRQSDIPEILELHVDSHERDRKGAHESRACLQGRGRRQHEQRRAIPIRPS